MLESSEQICALNATDKLSMIFEFAVWVIILCIGDFDDSISELRSFRPEIVNCIT